MPVMLVTNYEEHQVAAMESGCVRGFAVHGNRLYAAVEVGGLLRSDDAGKTWGLVAGSNGRPQFGRPPAKQIHPDVHSVAVHPSSPVTTGALSIT